MAATFVVETGTASATANSYCSVADSIQYHENYGNPVAWSGASQATKENALREATRALDFRYGSRWSGFRYTSSQALDWPRSYAIDSAGNEIAETTIPQRLKDAAAILALLHVQGTNINPTTRTEGDIRSESLQAASGASKSVTYAGSKPAEAQLLQVDRLLGTSGLLSGGTGGWGWLDL